MEEWTWRQWLALESEITKIKLLREKKNYDLPKVKECNLNFNLEIIL